MVYCRDFFFDRFVFICTIHSFPMIAEGRTGQLSDYEKDLLGMSLPQLLNCQRFLRWRRSSSKTKACKFLGILPLHADAEPPPADLLPPLSAIASAPPLDGKPFRPFFQIDSLPYGNTLVIADFKLPCRLAIANPFFLHRFYDQLLKFRCVSFVPYAFWHRNAPADAFSVGQFRLTTF